MLRDSKGFTIIELLITLSILALVATTCCGMTNVRDKNNLSITSSRIRTLIRQGQERAYKEESTQKLAFYVEEDVCYRIKNSMIKDELIIPQGITLKQTNFPSDNLYFRRKLAPNRGGTIILQSKNHRVRITVLPVTGRVRVYPLTKR